MFDYRKEKYKRIFLEVIKIIKNSEASWISNSLAYSFIVSFVPIIFATVIIGIRYFVTTTQLNELLAQNNTHIPYLETIINYVQNDFSNTSFFLVILLVVYSIYMGSNGIRSMIQANNLFFDMKPKSLVYNYLISFVIILILLISVYTVIAIIGFLPTLLRFLHLDFLTTYIHFLTFPILGLIFFVIFKLISGNRLKSSTIWFGSLISSLGITIIMTFSSRMLNESRLGTEIFGPMVTLVLFAQFLYFISLCIYYGMVFNVATYRVEHTMAQEAVIRENTLYK